MREIYDQFYQRNKSSEKNLLKLEECLYRYKGCIDDVIRKYDSNPHRPKNCSISFVQDELIFNEYERFIANDCFGGQKKEFDRLFSDLIKNDRKNTHFYQSKKSDIGRLLNSSSQKYADISKRTAKVQQELLKKNPGKAGEINRVFAKMNGLDLNNCFLISGYYGAGKTKLAYELAKNNLEVIHVFLSSNENLENQLKDSLNEIFGETETAKTLLNKYRDLQFVFVVDDLQRGFLSGNDIYEIFGFIEEYSQRNVKWLLLIQTDFVNWFQDIIKEYEENNAKIINAWDWSGELSAFVLYGWLKIDQRYKHIKAMDQMLLESTDVLPGWIEEVRLRNYFTPLFIRIVLSFKDHDELYLKPDISYPKFCKYYYGILAKNVFLEHGSKHYGTFPKKIVDYYIEYIFDYYIAENGFEGFKYLIKKHYDMSQRLSDGKQNINKAIVMAGAYFFRHINLEFYIKWDPEDYSEKYKDMVKSYAAAEAIWKKRLAMYLIIHVGIKENKYRINSSHDLLPVFRNLYKSKEMQTFLEDSAHTFYKSNFLNEGRQL